ncbi:MAG: hypothetical protein ABL982_26475 [Vicinamibacterales bacterium]
MYAMIISKTVKSMLVAAVAGFAAATYAIAQDAKVTTTPDGRTHVEAPTTRVDAGGDRGTQVKVRATDTKIDVDTDRGHVRIRVPYFNGDIRW